MIGASVAAAAVSAAAKSGGIAGRPPHQPDQHRARPGGVGDGAAAHAREDHVDQDVDVAEPAGDAADDGLRHHRSRSPIEPACDQMGGGDEHRDREQHVGLAASRSSTCSAATPGSAS